MFFKTFETKFVSSEIQQRISMTCYSAWMCKLLCHYCQILNVGGLVSNVLVDLLDPCIQETNGGAKKYTSDFEK